MVLVTEAGPRHALGMTVQGLVQELCDLARIDARFEHSLELATALQVELGELGEATVVMARPVHRRTRRRVARRNAAGESAVLASFHVEHQALSAVVRAAERETAQLSGRRISTLRISEEARRVFSEAGLDHVQEVIELPAVQPTLIPNVDTRALSELRAALMVALEASDAERKPRLPAARQDEDLFEGVAEGLGHLSWDQRETLVMRTGANDRTHSVEEVAEVMGCPVQLVPILEHQALNMLLSQPEVLNACWRLEALCAQYGIGWDDERLQKLVSALYPSTRANLTRLVAGLMREKGRVVAELGGRTFEEPRGVERFDEMVIATIGRYGELESEQLAAQLHAGLPDTDRAMYPDMRITDRVRILGPAVQGENGRFHLPDTPVPGVDDRHIRALNGLIGALQKLGSARISALTNEVNRRLPRQFHIDAEYVRTWLTRHPDLFVQSDADRFKLASLDVDILCGLAKSWSPGGNGSAAAAAVGISGGRAAEQRYERIALSIAEYLRREGPQPIWKIRSHLYGRVMGLASADVVVATYPLRFERKENGLVSLRPGDATGSASDHQVNQAASARRQSGSSNPEHLV